MFRTRIGPIGSKNFEVCASRNAAPLNGRCESPQCRCIHIMHPVCLCPMRTLLMIADSMLVNSEMIDRDDSAKDKARTAEPCSIHSTSQLTMHYAATQT